MGLGQSGVRWESGGGFPRPHCPRGFRCRQCLPSVPAVSQGTRKGEEGFIVSLGQGEGTQTCPLVRRSLRTGDNGTEGRWAEAVGHGIPHSPASDERPFHGKDESPVRDHGTHGLRTVCGPPGPWTRVSCGPRLQQRVRAAHEL